jgi:outer membrane protein, multidrug efflux system
MARSAAFLAAVATGLLALSGCATPTPEVAKLAGVEVPQRWAQAVPAGTASLAQWWRGFGDPLLMELVDAADRANTDLGVATANLRQARAARDESAAALLPSLSVSGSAERSRRAGTGSQNLFDAGFDAAWELDAFGGTAHAVAAQDALVRAGAASLASTRLSVAAEVALSYLELRTAQVRTDVARENLASQEETLQISRWRQQAGLASSLEVEQALSAVEQTRAAVPSLQSAAARAAHALAVLTGQPPSALVQTLSGPGAVPLPNDDFEVAIPLQTLRQRPDVTAAEQQWRAAAERVGQAGAQRLPSVNMAASLGWSSLTLGSLGSGPAVGSLLAAIAQPVLDGGRLNAQMAGRQAELAAAQESYRGRVLLALQEVEDALVTLASARERLAALQRAFEAARNAALLATQRYASGLIDFQTVLETQRTLLNVQDSVASARSDVATAHVRLYKAIGGGWNLPSPEVSS